MGARIDRCGLVGVLVFIKKAKKPEEILNEEVDYVFF